MDLSSIIIEPRVMPSPSDGCSRIIGWPWGGTESKRRCGIKTLNAVPSIVPISAGDGRDSFRGQTGTESPGLLFRLTGFLKRSRRFKGLIFFTGQTTIRFTAGEDPVFPRRGLTHGAKPIAEPVEEIIFRAIHGISGGRYNGKDKDQDEK